MDKETFLPVNGFFWNDMAFCVWVGIKFFWNKLQCKLKKKNGKMKAIYGNFCGPSKNRPFLVIIWRLFFLMILLFHLLKLAKV